MARPISLSQCRRLQAQKAIKYHCIVIKDEQPYTIWRDEIGPIYSTPATDKELKDAGIRDTVYMEPGYDTVTHRMMARDPNDRMPQGERLLAD